MTAATVVGALRVGAVVHPWLAMRRLSAARATTAAKAFRSENIVDCLSKARSETDTEKFGFVLILLEACAKSMAIGRGRKP